MVLDNSGTNKERESGNFFEKGGQGEEEIANIVEVGRPPNIPSGLKNYLEKAGGEDNSLPNPVLDGETGQALVTSSLPQSPKIVLPLTVSEYQTGLKESIGLAWRWLSEWSGRVKKMLGGKVGFRTKYDCQ